MEWASKDIASAGSALGTLVKQFSDPFSCFRELVQNSVDAGATYLSVRVVEDQDPNFAQIIIEDNGSGMDAHVIDTQLTRLFASRKDGDLTRIGKFGIGFVSVFALDPNRISLETASEGESWLVEFSRDGSFERTPLQAPREGTLIRVFRRLGKQSLEELRTSCRESLAYWCKHVDAELLFEDEALNQEFQIDAVREFRWSEPGTDIIICYSQDGSSYSGFYNQGLTLKESRDNFVWPGLEVKANSRFLEHTLTRDQIVEDENFHKVRDRIQTMLESEFVPFLLKGISRGLHRESGFDSLIRHFFRQNLCRVLPEDLSRETGESKGGHWRVQPGEHKPGYLFRYGLQQRDLAEGVDCAEVALAVQKDSYTSSQVKVGRLFLWDTEEKHSLCQRELFWGDFTPDLGFNSFALDFPSLKAKGLELCFEWFGELPLTLRDIHLGRKVDRDFSLSPEDREIPVFRTPTGEGVCVERLHRHHQAGSLRFVNQTSRLSAELEAAANLVILAEPATREWEFLKLLLGHEPALAEWDWLAPCPDESNQHCWDSLYPRIRDLLDSVQGLKIESIHSASSDCGQNWGALFLPRLEGLHPWSKELEAGRGVLVLNSHHELVWQAAALTPTKPAMAAYLLSKLLLSETGISAKRDAELALRAWSSRDA